MPIRVINPAQTMPRVGEAYRFVYRFTNSIAIRETWPGAVWRQVDNDYRWKVEGFLSVPEVRGVVVDVTVQALPDRTDFANLEDMVSAIRRFSMSQDVTCDLVAIESIQATELNDTSRQSSAGTSPSVWGEPAPEDQIDTTAPSVVESVGEAVTGTVTDVWSGLRSLFLDTTEVVGTGAGNILGGALRPSVLVVLIVGGVVAVYYLKGKV